MRRPPKRVIVAIVAAEVVSATFAWRDIRNRPDDQVRGSKKGWRVFVLMNPGNSLIYWLFGRRRTA